MQVRRKADPAKELVKEFVGKWQDRPEVVGDVTHDEMKSEQRWLNSPGRQAVDTGK